MRPWEKRTRGLARTGSPASLRRAASRELPSLIQVIDPESRHVRQRLPAPGSPAGGRRPRRSHPRQPSSSGTQICAR
jgi:hypothetical protein